MSQSPLPFPSAGQPMPGVSVPPKKSRTLVIMLSVVGGLLGLCCLAGVVAAVAADPKPTPETAGAGDLPNPSTTGVPNPGGATSKAAEPAPTEPQLPPGTVTDTGELLVGTDIKPDTYRGVGCRYWARLKNADGDLNSILANGNVGRDEHLTVTILTSDYAFDNSCDYLSPVSALRTVPESDTSDEFGTLVVGKDIHPGTWRGTATGSCYWARTSGFTGEFDEILANNNVEAGSKFTITVKTGDKGLELGSDCANLTRVS